MNQPSKVPIKSEWELLDEIGKELTHAIKRSEEVTCPQYIIKLDLKDTLVRTKNLNNQLKSLLIEKSRKVE